MRKVLLILLVALISVGVFAEGWLLFGKLAEADKRAQASLAVKEQTAQTPEETQAPAETEPEPTQEPETEATEAESSYTLTFVGDCTLGCNLSHTYIGYGFIKTVNGDIDYPFANVKSFFENDEYTVVNLEGPLCDGGNPVVKEHVFRGSPSYVNMLTENSVEFASLANNHAQDYGNAGYAETKEHLDKAGIAYVERDNSVTVTTRNGLTIGFYGSVYYMIDPAVVARDIAALKNSGVDLVIYVPHWGNEMSYVATDEQINLAHIAIDSGADIVAGSHPHVLQPVEEYNGGIIYYSLANFSFGGNIYPEDYDSVLIQQEVIRQSDGTVRLGETTLVPVCISSIPDRNDYRPVLYEEGSEGYRRVMSKLNGTFR